ncbi:MAG: T9SS type A sorting domain-containing protein [Bacteroidales bacterium]|jgi:hypothetical protein|nr:T9SS type A sorting domain-containing protein [Bacteroidales bacterium]
MKTFILFFLLSIFFSFNLLKGQNLVVNAGNDTILCSPESYQLNASVVGGETPYLYCWETSYFIEDNEYFASFFLNDTAIQNPIITNFPLNDTLIFYLTVTDNLGAEQTDTINIITSNFILTTQDLRETINKGDCISLYTNVSGGILPYIYAWYPNIEMNDSTLANPIVCPNEAIAYHCIITDSAGCLTENDIFEVNVISSVESTNKDNCSIHPNPATNILHFSEAKTYKILDIQGRVLMQSNIKQNYANIQGLRKGVYFIKLEDKLFKFVKN